MKHARATALMVLDAQTGQPKGILTEADIAHAVADGKDLNEIRIRELTTIRPAVKPPTTVREPAQIMTSRWSQRPCSLARRVARYAVMAILPLG
jgi:CBS domain-containing protein